MPRIGLIQKLSIRRCVGARQLPCGCSLGLYETYRGQTLAVLDARAAGCPSRDHSVGAILDRPPNIVTFSDER